MKNSIIRNIIFQLKRIIIPEVAGKDSCILIQKQLCSDSPTMIARLGAVEIKAVLYGILPPLKFLLKKYIYIHLHQNAGFFPINDNEIKKFSDLMLNCMKQVDILASWRPEEIFFRRQLKQSIRISLIDLNPTIDQEYAWSSILKDKNILVIHPFAKSIEQQYNANREHLFNNKYILPKFKSLQTITAIQTIAGNTAGFNSWFEALKYMEDEICKKDFDIALIGCGAYGFPLAAFIKDIGKKAVHIGGALQLFFGIKGKRWDSLGYYNEYWIKPSSAERPQNLGKVEDGCYW